MRTDCCSVPRGASFFPGGVCHFLSDPMFLPGGLPPRCLPPEEAFLQMWRVVPKIHFGIKQYNTLNLVTIHTNKSLNTL